MNHCTVLFDYLDPAFRSLDAAHLDAGQCLIQLLGDRSHLGHAAREADLFAVIDNLANRGDNGCCTAKTALCKVFYFVEVDLTLLNLESEVVLCYYEQRAAGNGRKDAA